MADLPESHHYSSDEIDQIIKAVPGGLPPGNCESDQELEGVFRMVPRREALAWRLDVAAANYLTSKQIKRAAPSDLAKRFHAVSAAAALCLEALGISQSDPPDKAGIKILGPLRHRVYVAIQEGEEFPLFPPEDFKVKGEAYTDHREREIVENAIQGVQQLTRWAAECEARELGRVGRAKKRNQGDKDFDDLIGSLVGIWIDVFERPIKTSVAGPESTNAGDATGPLVRFIRRCLEPLGINKSADAIRERVRKPSRMGKSRHEEI